VGARGAGSNGSPGAEGSNDSELELDVAHLAVADDVALGRAAREVVARLSWDLAQLWQTEAEELAGRPAIEGDGSVVGVDDAQGVALEQEHRRRMIPQGSEHGVLVPDSGPIGGFVAIVVSRRRRSPGHMGPESKM
jgi:hypothetical protein